MVDIVNAAGLLQKLLAVGLRAYLLYNGRESSELIVELLAWTLWSDIFA